METEALIAYYLRNYREPNAYREMADAMEAFEGPASWLNCAIGCRESITCAQDAAALLLPSRTWTGSSRRMSIAV